MLSLVQPTGESLALDDQAYLISSAKGTINFKLVSKMWRLHISAFSSFAWDENQCQNLRPFLESNLIIAFLRVNTRELHNH